MPSRVIEGRWRAALRLGEVWLEMRLDGRSRHQNSFTLNEFELTGTGADGIPGFRLVRDAGMFHFDGGLAERERDGHFEFRSNPDCVTPEFVREILDAGIEDLSASRLVEFRIHGVSANFVKEIESLGLPDRSASRLVEMRIHGRSLDEY